MRPFLSLAAPAVDVVVRRHYEPRPVERLLRDGLYGAVSRPDVPLLLDRLGDLDRWDGDACREIRNDVAARSMMHPSFNERFVTDQLDRVGSGSAAGLRVRERWLGARLARFTEHVDATYRTRGWPLSSTLRSYLRALFVACLMRAKPVSAEDAPAPPSLTRRSGP